MSLNLNGRIFACPCGQGFERRFPGQRYCSQACVARYGKAKLPAAKPIDTSPAPAPAPAPVPFVPRAVLRSQQWMREHADRKWPS